MYWMRRAGECDYGCISIAHNARAHLWQDCIHLEACNKGKPMSRMFENNIAVRDNCNWLAMQCTLEKANEVFTDLRKWCPNECWLYGNTYLRPTEFDKEFKELKEKIESIIIRGFGKLLMQNEEVYEGEYVKDDPHGHGTYIWYKTEWGHVDNPFPAPSRFAPDGQGKFIFSNGAVYDGEFKNGYLDGQGTLTLSNGATYKGEFKRGYPHGQGKLTTADMRVYEGNFDSTLFDSYLDRVKDSLTPYTDAFNRGNIAAFVSKKLEDYFNAKLDRASKRILYAYSNPIKKLQNLVKLLMQYRTTSDIDIEFYELARKNEMQAFWKKFSEKKSS